MTDRRTRFAEGLRKKAVALGLEATLVHGGRHFKLTLQRGRSSVALALSVSPSSQNYEKASEASFRRAVRRLGLQP